MLVRISLRPIKPARAISELVFGNATLISGGILPFGYEHDGAGHAAISVGRLHAPRAVEILRAAGFRVTAMRQAWIPRRGNGPRAGALRVASARPSRIAPSR